MNIVVTGAAGFLGKKLIKALLSSGVLHDHAGKPHAISRITALDITALSGIDDPRLVVMQADLSNAADMQRAIADDTDSVFHLAAVVSGQAEREYELGMRVNFDATRLLLEHLRKLPRPVRMIVTSSVAVFGGELPACVPDSQVWMPQSAYGTQKAMADLLLSDYSRRGFVDGRSLRMPTIVVRPGKPNAAASSFASGIIREPLNGEKANCPVSPDTRLWLISPDAAVAALIHGHNLQARQLAAGRVINLCGLSVTVQEMLEALRRSAGEAVMNYLSFDRQPEVEAIVNSWPGDFHADYASQLGFRANDNFDQIISEYIAAERPTALR